MLKGMRKLRKKVASVLIVAAMLLTMLPANALAASGDGSTATAKLQIQYGENVYKITEDDWSELVSKYQKTYRYSTNHKTTPVYGDEYTGVPLTDIMSYLELDTTRLKDDDIITFRDDTGVTMTKMSVRDVFRTDRYCYTYDETLGVFVDDDAKTQVPIIITSAATENNTNLGMLVVGMSAIDDGDGEFVKQYWWKGLFNTEENQFVSIEIPVPAEDTITGTGTEDDPYLIYNADELVAFSNAVNSGEASDAYAKLMNDIDVSDREDFFPIGTYADSHTFDGQFDGNGKTVTVNLNCDVQAVGLFGYISNGAVVKDVTVNGSVVGGGSTVSMVGGVVGRGGTESKISGCINNANVVGTNIEGKACRVGGIVGSEQGASYISDCINNGTVTGYTSTVGGIIAYASYLNNVAVPISDCVNNGTIISHYEKMGTGGIVGLATRIEISDCSNNGTVTAAGYQVGGILGMGQAGTKITNCENTAAVKGTYQVGGVCGYITTNANVAWVKGCSNTGSISATYDVGGIIGTNLISDISDCYNQGAVTAADLSGSTSGVGGIIGNRTAGSSLTIKNCYNTGTISAEGTAAANAGDFIGYNANAIELTNTYYVGNKGVGAVAEGITVTDNSAQKTVAELSVMADTLGEAYQNSCGGAVFTYQTAIAHSFGEWTDDPDSDDEGAVIRTCTVCGTAQTSTLEILDGFASGSGTKEDPYIISNAEQLKNLADKVNSGKTYEGTYFRLSNDIDLNNEEWTPIGGGAELEDYTPTYKFLGNFDGNGKTIKNLNLNTTTSFTGLFGYNGGTVENFTVEGSVVVTGETNYVSPVVAFNAGTIRRVINKATITAETSSSIGGIAGINVAGKWDYYVLNGDSKKNANLEGAVGIITECGNEADMTIYHCAGGIAGNNYGYISSCYNHGNIDIKWNGSMSKNGGIAGTNGNTGLENGVGHIVSCYNTGGITWSGPASARGYGGMVCFASITSSITNCYSIGTLQSGYDDWAPIIPRYDTPIYMINNYSIDTVISCADSGLGESNAHNGTRKTEAELKSAEFISEIGGSFAQDTNNLNNGYPVLKWQNATSVTVEKLETNVEELTFVEGQKFDPTKLKIYKVYTDGTKEYIPSYNYTASKTDAFTMEDDGTTLTVTCGEMSFDVKVNVERKQLDYIRISTRPTKYTYSVGEEFDPTGMKVQVWYSNELLSSSEKYATLEDEAYTITTNGTLSENNKTITVSYTLNGKTSTASFDVITISGVEPEKVTEEDGTEIYQIRTVDDFVWFAKQITYLGRTELNAILLNDIDVSKADFVSIGTSVTEKVVQNITAAEGASGPSSEQTLSYAYNNPYKGTFDGNGKSVTLNISGANYVGTFGQANGATIRNLSVDGSVTATGSNAAGIVGNGTSVNITNCVNNADVTAVSNVAGIEGRGSGSTITGCTNNGNITATSNYAAGITGYSVDKIVDCVNKGAVKSATYAAGIAGRGHELEDCVNEGTITATGNYAGGIVAFGNTAGVISGCANTGNVQGGSYVGGIYGNGYSNKIENCYNKGAVTATGATSTAGVGGIVGTKHASYALNIVNCYNAGIISNSGAAEDAAVGELVGSAAGTVATRYLTISNSYYLQDSESEKASIGKQGTTTTVTDESQPKTLVELSELAETLGEAYKNSCGGAVLTYQTAAEHSYSEWIEDSASTESGAVSRTCTVCGKTQTNTLEILDGFASGTGTEEDPYIISNAEQLKNLADKVNSGKTYEGKYFRLSNDIDLNNEAWTPIGGGAELDDGTAANKFMGNFDGNGKTIKNLMVKWEAPEETVETTEADSGMFIGLFGYNGGTIENLTVEGSVTYLGTKDYIGGVAGFNAGTIKRVISKVTISAETGYNVGGIAGINVGGKWFSEYKGNQQIENAVGLITECGNEGNLTIWRSAGGITGKNYGMISNCYNRGNIDIKYNGSMSKNGGIAGSLGDTGTEWGCGHIVSCYNTGDISWSGSASARGYGGIVCFTSKSSSVTNCYSIGKIQIGYADCTPIIPRRDSDLYHTNNYSLDTVEFKFGSSTPANSTTGYAESELATLIGIRKTEAELKSAEFISEIGGSFAQDIKNLNNGYPVLKWQNGTSVTVEKLEANVEELTFVEGQTFNPGNSPLVMYKVYGDGSKELIPTATYTADKTDAFTMEDDGTTLTISCSAGSVDVKVNVEQKELTYIQISTLPTKYVYTEGETFDPTGMKVRVNYGNEELAASEKYATLADGTYTVKAEGELSDTNKTVTVTYTLNGKTSSVSFDVMVLKAAVPETDEDGVYQIRTADELAWFANQVTYLSKTTLNATLVNDIDASKTALVPIGITGTSMKVEQDVTAAEGAAGPATSPVAYLYLSASYSGTFDGNGKTVTVNLEGGNNTALFAVVNGATIKNLTVDGTVTGTGYVAGIVANGAATVTNCVNKADVTSTGNYTAGVAAYGGSTITDCGNEGNITGTAYVGGIHASGLKAISGCYNTGNVKGTNNVGGILAWLPGYTTITVSNCYNKGAVEATALTATTGVGGIAGMRNAYNKATLENCYNAGTVTYSGEAAEGVTYPVGSLIGYDAATNTTYKLAITNSYYLQNDEVTTPSIGVVKTAETVTDESQPKTLGELSELAETLGEAYKNSCGGAVLTYQTAQGHRYSDWSEDTATFEEGGTQSRICADCGHVDTRTTEAKGVSVTEEAIDAIGTVTLDSKAFIDVARSFYDKLAADQKALVENYDKLTAAEARYAELKEAADKEAADKAAADQAKADTVAAAINAIGEVTLESKDAIDAARTAYDALTADQKALVDNYEVLTAAESRYAELKEAADKEAADKAAADQAKADTVAAAINAIGEVTLESKEAIRVARTLYDGLTADQKALVENYEALETAEARYAELEEEASRPKNCWSYVDGNWYHFDASGEMQYGWQYINGKWYYLGKAGDGVMKSGWQYINSKWYYLGGADDGSMKSGWQYINSKWYYLGEADDGSMKSGWQYINSKWYYLGGADDGSMKTGWQYIGGKWYYMNSNGAMQTGWLKWGNNWYYLYNSGAMAVNTWIGAYYVNQNGVWVQ